MGLHGWRNRSKERGIQRAGRWIHCMRWALRGAGALNHRHHFLRHASPLRRSAYESAAGCSGLWCAGVGIAMVRKGRLSATIRKAYGAGRLQRFHPRQSHYV